MSVILALSLTFALNSGDTTTNSPWPYQHVEKQSGLSNSAINSVFMDAYEHIWLGTWDGLNHYDGSAIKIYKPDPFTKGTISNNVIRNFLEDGYKNLWVVTHQGINKYNRDTDQFTPYLDVLNDVPLLEYNIRACAGEDSAIWVSLIGKGIRRYSVRQNDFVPVRFSGIDDTWLASVIDLASYRGLFYFLGSDNRLVSTVNNRLVQSKQLVTPAPVIFHKFLTLNGRFFLAIATSGGELLFYDVNELDNEPERIALGDVAISSISESLNNAYLWIGTESGSIFKITYFHNRLEAQSMNTFFPIFAKAKIKILDITETGMDLVWVATDGDGIYKFMTRPKAFQSLSAGAPQIGELSHNIVRAIYEDQSGTLYIGTRGGGLNIKRPGISAMRIINSKNQLSNDAVLSINKDRHGNIWIGVDGEGVEMIEAATGRILHFPRDFENAGDLSFGSVYSICVDAFNDIWLGTSGYGVVHLKVSPGKQGKYRLKEYEQLQHSGKHDQITIKSNIVYSIVEEKPNILWFGTRGGGLYRYNAITRQLEDHIEANTRSKNSLGNNDILSLCIDSQEQLWIGTSGGLNRLYLQTKPYRIDRYTQYEGLPANTIHAIQEDSRGDIWMSTNDGLVMLNRESTIFKKFDNNDGLQNVEFTDGASFKSKISEKLFFGGVRGLDIVYPSKINTSRYFPRLTLTQFYIRNVPVLPGDNTKVLSNYIDLTNSVSLTYDQNFISFDFTILDYWNKQKSKFAYYLENFDKDWNYIGHQQSVSFTNIPPGSYTLYLKYTNENGDWAPNPRAFAITLSPPFWKTPWAYGFYFLLALGIQASIIFFLRWRMKRKRITAMENFKALQVKEMNDYKLQFFTNIAHEFRTPLTLILGPVSALLKNKHDEKESRQLKTIYSNSLRMQKLVDELMQFRKIESGKDTLEITEFEVISFLAEIVESFEQFAADRELQLEFYPQQDTLQVFLDRRKLEKILINLISNAIKYSLPGGAIGVFVRQSGNQVVFEIKDEGIGIAEQNIDKVFESFYQNSTLMPDPNGLAKSTGIGLSLTRSLVQAHRGSISVESKTGKGSVFRVSLPFDQASYPESSDSAHLVTSGSLSEKVSLEFVTDRDDAGQTDTASHAARKKLYSVLAVDDNPNVLSLLNNLLAEHYTVYKAVNGKKALQVLEETKIDLVVSDILMPEMDGLELCKTIKDNIQTSHIPVILLTAKGEIENRIEGLQAGADSYIPKPFHPDHLAVRIDKLLERMELIRKKFRNFSEVELHQLSTGISERDDLFFSKIIACIQNHLSETEFNADIMADEVGMSKASLYKKIKNITGLTPHGLIKQYRLKKAAELLKNSGMSVSEVIYETGFNSRSYFYKSFNEVYNCHPKDFAARSEPEDKPILSDSET